MPKDYQTQQNNSMSPDPFFPRLDEIKSFVGMLLTPCSDCFSPFADDFNMLGIRHLSAHKKRRPALAPVDPATAAFAEG